MRSTPALLCLATLLSPHASAESSSPTAIRKLAPNPSDKLLREHLAFAPLHILSPREAAAAAISFIDKQDDELLSRNATERFYRPAFAPHSEESRDTLLRRAAEVLALLERRSSCPEGMNSCSDIDSEVKCCQQGTYCVDVGDAVAGGIACCPDGASCGGGVGACPDGSTSCSEALGGGCCIPGYVCQGLGCVPSAAATTTKTTTQTTAQTTQEPSTIITTAQETTIDEVSTTKEPTVEPTTESETKIKTTGEEEPTTASEAKTETESETGGNTVTATAGSVTGIAPYRPTGTSVTSSDDEETQTGCPTGFYGCLATHGGGCCRTGRNCDINDCPAPSTTIVSNGATVVILATDAPPAPGPTSTCGSGWFLCGKDAGPVAGCCPDGYDCGTASCFTVQASETGRIQKELPEADVAGHERPAIMMVIITMAVVCLALA
ncbi:hypothetical protein FGRMN_9445 [Fusarium graminum]|nr:hypothetical protein FGRMN_9445 [Fusarium graminum]